MTKQKVVYEIRCPETDRVMYVGATINPKRRFYSHLYFRSNNQKRNELAIWIKQVKEKGLRPIFKNVKILPDNATKAELTEAERLHTIKINKHTKTFNKFFGRSHTEETKKWVSDGNRNRKLTKLSHYKMSISNSKYKFICDGEVIYGLMNLSKKIGVEMRTLHYRLKDKRKLSDKHIITVTCLK